MSDTGYTLEEIRAERERRARATRLQAGATGQPITLEAIRRERARRASQQTQQAPQTQQRPVGAGADVALSALQGAQNIPGIIAGIPGDIGRLWDENIAQPSIRASQDWGAGFGQWLEDRHVNPFHATPEEEAAYRTRNAALTQRMARTPDAPRVQLPSSADINAAMARTTGFQHTPQTEAGRVAETVTEFLPMAFGGEAGLATRATRVLAPALTSEGAGQLAHQYAPEMEGPARFVGALGGSVGAEYAMQGAGAAMRARTTGAAAAPSQIPGPVRQTITALARRNRMTSADVERELTAAQDNPQGQVLADVFGDAGVRQTRAIAQAPGETGGLAQQTARDRFQEAPDRIINALNRRLGVGQSPTEAMAALSRDYAQASADLYNPIWQNPLTAEQRANLERQTAPLMQTPLMQRAITRADELFANDVGIGVVDGAPDQNMGRWYHYLKMGLDDAIMSGRRDGSLAANGLRQATEARRQLLSAMDANIPNYSEARARWAGLAEAEDALEQGATFLNMRPEEIAQSMDEMTPFARHHARIGLANAIETKLGLRGSVNGNRNVAEALGSPEMQRRVAAAFETPQQAADFLDELNTQNRLMRNAGQWGGGSSTYSNQTHGEELLGHMVDAGGHAATGNLGRATMRMAQGVQNFITGGAVERANNARGAALLRRIDGPEAKAFTQEVVRILRAREGSRSATPFRDTFGGQTNAFMGLPPLPRFGKKPPAVEEPTPVGNAAREVGPNGMPIAPAQPFRNSLRYGSEDLGEAAAMQRRGAQSPDAGGAGLRRLRGPERPLRPGDSVSPDAIGWHGGPPLTPWDYRSGAVRRMFGGENAATADHAALARAREMAAQGISRDDIWRETGWGQGVDGKWRFEIDDSGARVTIPHHASVYELADKYARDNFGVSKFVDLPFGDPRRYEALEFGQKNAESVASIRSDLRPLDQILSHNPVYEAYPQLRDVRAGAEFEPGLKGSYSPSTRTLRTGGEGWLGIQPGETRSVTLHETQHAIQDIEKFARGGMPETALDDAHLEAINQEMSRLARGMENRRSYRFNTGIDTKAVDAEIADMNREYHRLMRLRSEAFGPNARREGYNRLAGEVEARNVQTRLNMTPEERRATPPWATEDVPEPDQIVRFRSSENAHDGGASHVEQLRAQGFDVERPLYRGHQGDPSTGRFRATEDGASGPGIYLTETPEKADYWAQRLQRRGAGPPTVHKVYVRGQIAEAPLGYEEARAQGYAGFRLRDANGNEVETVIFDPANVEIARNVSPNADANLGANGDDWFDVYHASNRDFEGPLRRSGSGALGPGSYVARRPATTEMFAGRRPGSDNAIEFSPGAHIRPLQARGKLASPAEWEAAVARAQQRLRIKHADSSAVQDAAVSDLQARGFSGVEDQSRDFINIFNPEADLRDRLRRTPASPAEGASAGERAGTRPPWPEGTFNDASGGNANLRGAPELAAAWRDDDAFRQAFEAISNDRSVSKTDVKALLDHFFPHNVWRNGATRADLLTTLRQMRNTDMLRQNRLAAMSGPLPEYQPHRGPGYQAPEYPEGRVTIDGLRRVRLSDADRALLAELEDGAPPSTPNGSPDDTLRGLTPFIAAPAAYAMLSRKRERDPHHRRTIH